MDPGMYIATTIGNFITQSLGHLEILTNTITSAYVPKGTLAGTGIIRNSFGVARNIVGNFYVQKERIRTEDQLRKYALKNFTE
jgi:hypothetical protein